MKKLRAVFRLIFSSEYIVVTDSHISYNMQRIRIIEAVTQIGTPIITELQQEVNQAEISKILNQPTK